MRLVCCISLFFFSSFFSPPLFLCFIFVGPIPLMIRCAETKRRAANYRALQGLSAFAAEPGRESTAAASKTGVRGGKK